ncbi:MAG: serine kinase [Armatimonadetes bacterium]|nr:serine kinase [Armatimonadota bacterium]
MVQYITEGLLEEIAQTLSLENVSGTDAGITRATGVYVSDLLSDVMGQAHSGEIWVTVQSHLNVVAVAALKELSAVIICQSREVAPAVAARAKGEGVVLFRTPLSAYEVCGKLWELGLRRAA